MESIDPYIVLKEQALNFLNFYKECGEKPALRLPKEEVETLWKKIERGYCLNLVSCGAAKAGKSTTLKYLLGNDPSDTK